MGTKCIPSESACVLCIEYKGRRGEVKIELSSPVARQGPAISAWSGREGRCESNTSGRLSDPLGRKNEPYYSERGRNSHRIIAVGRLVDATVQRINKSIIV